ncbi:Rhodanese-like domain-containing protein [Zostera marina]|uniref:Rhodanese-like domain-containing protein n=1 Tax=Zostera marina TaxID=29655 RepID=A0A0K9P638_ZOSMR|nr:Rhodanese-like domain-containing protein [Zostera marina]
MECGGKRSEEEVAENIDPKMAKELLQSGYRYLDVRTVNEYRKGNVKDSINIPYWFLNSKGRETNPQFMELVLKSFSKDDYIVVACASGTRSAAASLDLINSGFKHVKNMSCGYNGWTKAGLNKNKITSNL